MLGKYVIFELHEEVAWQWQGLWPLWGNSKLTSVLKDKTNESNDS